VLYPISIAELGEGGSVSSSRMKLGSLICQDLIWFAILTNAAHQEMDGVARAGIVPEPLPSAQQNRIYLQLAEQILPRLRAPSMPMLILNVCAASDSKR
jgi:hypothetical protein